MGFITRSCFESDGFIAFSNEWDWREKNFEKKKFEIVKINFSSKYVEKILNYEKYNIFDVKTGSKQYFLSLLFENQKLQKMTKFSTELLFRRKMTFCPVRNSNLEYNKYWTVTGLYASCGFFCWQKLRYYAGSWFIIKIKYIFGAKLARWEVRREWAEKSARV